MISPNTHWSFRVVFTLMIAFHLAACAGYPSDPRAPQPNDDTYAAEEDTVLNIPADEGILVNDKAREGIDIILLTVGEIQTDNGGIINIAENGGFTYEPAADFNGTDQVAYTIRNQKGKESGSVIFLNVAPVNDAPRPVDDRIQISGDAPATVNVLANDVEPDGDAMTVADTGDPGRGSVRINADGSLTYTPQANHSGEVRFSYTVSDGTGETAQAWVFITVGTGWAQADALTMMEDGVLTLPVSALSANDGNPDGSGALTVIEVGQAQFGTAVLNGNGTFTYTPLANYSGTDTFIYTVQSQSGSTASAVVTVTIEAVADPPTISDIPDLTIAQGTSTDFILFTVSDPDLDPTSDNLIVTAVVTDATPQNLIPDDGIIIGGGLSETWAIRITPNAALFGSATIRVTVSDGQLEASDAFTLTVTPADTPPTISAIADQVTTVNTPLTVDFRVNDDQTPPAALTVTAASGNQAVVSDDNISYGGAGLARSITITPNAGATGAAAITVRVSDGIQTSQVTFQFTVTGEVVNTAPTIGAIAPQAILQNTFIEVSFTVGDGETAPALLEVTASSDNPTLVPNDPSNIILYNNGADRSIMLIPAVDQTGSAIITITVSDGELSTNRSFELTVSP